MTETEQTTGPVKMLHSVVSLDYERPPTLAYREYADAIKQKRLIGHKCPECGRIFTPPRGYCPICVVTTEREHQVDLPDNGVLVTYTVLNPDALQAQGGEAKSRGSVMLDGTNITLMGDLIGIGNDDVHTGIRLKAVWSDKPGGGDMSGWGVPGIRGWEPTGEPDATPEEVQSLIKEAAASGAMGGLG